MSKQTRQLIGIGSVFILGAVSVWLFLSVQNIDKTNTVEVKPIDYTPLEKAVGIWEVKEPFSMSGAKRAESAPEENTESDDEEAEALTVAIRNGSREAGAAADIERAISAIEGVSVESTGNTDDTGTTSVAYIESADQEIINRIAGILAPLYGDITRTVLSESPDFDIIITIGNSSTPSSVEPGT